MTPPSGTETDSSQKVSSLAAVQSEQLFRAIFEQAAVGIALIETLTGRFLRVNQRYCEIVGLSRDEMTATTFMAITHPGDLQADLSHMEELKAGRIHDFSMEKRYFKADGAIVWVELTVSPMWERGEQPTFHIAVVQDITERKRAQAALRMTEGQLTEVLKNSTAMVFMKDREGRYLQVNQAFERRFGLNAGQVLGKTDMDIFPASQAVMFQAHDQEVIRSGMLMEFEEVAQYADGKHTSIVMKFPLRNAENSIYAIGGIVTDITDRKQAEQNLAHLNATLEQQVAQRTRELEESRQQLQAILDGTSDAVFVKDPEGRYLLANNATGRFVGKRQDEVLGRDDRSIFSPADAQAVMEGDRKVMAGGVTTTYEDIATTADGVRRTFLSTKGPLFDGQGRVTGLFGICRDITERKHAEKALRESEDRFRRIFEHAGIGIAITDMNGRFLRCNPAYCTLLGYSEEEFHDLTFPMLVHPDDLVSNMAEIKRVISQELPWFEIENRYCHKGGHDVWVHKFVSVLRDDSGQPTNLFALVTDVTERRRMQEVLEQRVAERTEAVRASEAFNREVLDSLSAHVAVLDASGVIVAVNRVWERAAMHNNPSGLARVSIGANYVTVCERAANKSTEVRRVLEGIRDVLAGQTHVFEAEYLCAWPGHQQWFSMRVTPLGGRGGCVIAHEDITDRKFSEEALRDSYQRLQKLSREVQGTKERERSRLSRELHDEFGQVLTGLKFDLTDMAGTRVKNRRGAVTALQQKATRALGMVDRLFASLRGMVSALRPSLLEELGLVSALESLATETQEQSGLGCHIVADRVNFRACCGVEVENAIYRMAQELLTNVVRHAKASTATVTLGCTDGWVTLRVEDNGRGFDTRRVRKTNRFGLQGIRERAELLGGQVEIVSKPQAGTVVTIQVPLELHASCHRGVASAQRPKSATTRKKRRRGN